MGNETEMNSNVTEISETLIRVPEEEINVSELTNAIVTRVEVILMSALFVLTIVGNLIVIFILLFYRKSRKKPLSRMSFYIIHLSVADISVAIMSILPQIIWRKSIVFGKYQALCKLVAFSQVFSVYGSTFMLIVMAYDRYMCICWPIKSCSWTYKSGFVGVLVAWVAAALVSSPQPFLFAIQPRMHPIKNQYYNTCSVKWPSKVHEGAYFFFHMSTQFLIPLIILIFFYTNIFLAVSKSITSKKESLKIECLRVSPSGSFSTAIGTSGYSNGRSSSLAGLTFSGPRMGPSLTVRGLSPSVKRGRTIETAKNSIELRPLNRENTLELSISNQSNGSSVWKKLSNNIDTQPIRQSVPAKTLTKSKIKTLKLTLTVVITYVLCTLPFYASNITNLMIDVSSKSHSSQFLQFLMNAAIVTSLFYQLNSCANPFIYMVFNGNACKIIQKEKNCCCTGRINTVARTRNRTSGQDRTLQTELSELSYGRIANGEITKRFLK